MDLTPFVTPQAWTMFALGVAAGVILDATLRPIIDLWAVRLWRRDGR